METKEYAYLLENVIKNKFNYAYDPQDLWKKAENKKVITYNMKDVRHWIYYPCWSKNKCFISIYQVLNQKNKFPQHIKRIKKADINYPLIVIEDKFDKYGSILDGNHRFAKMILENKRKIKVVFFTKKELEKIRIRL